MDFTYSGGGIHGTSQKEQKWPVGQSWPTGDRARRSAATSTKMGAPKGDGGQAGG
jgi:hypothetical protein